MAGQISVERGPGWQREADWASWESKQDQSCAGAGRRWIQNNQGIKGLDLVGVRIQGNVMGRAQKDPGFLAWATRCRWLRQGQRRESKFSQGHEELSFKHVEFKVGQSQDRVSHPQT